MAAKKGEKLSHKEESFVEAYLSNGGNGSEAAKAAGYSERSSREMARRLLTKVDIRSRIAARIGEAKVTSDEVVGVLSAQMRGQVVDVLPDDGGIISAIKKSKLGHLVKKIKIRREIQPGTKKVFELVEVEVYSSQAAAIQISKILGMEKQPGVNPEDEKARVEAAIAAWMEETGGTRQQAIKYLAPQMPEVVNNHVN